MSIRVTVSLDTDEYLVFDDTTPVTIQLTERQAAICLSLVVLGYGRSVWNNMTDVEWEAIESQVASILEQLSIP